MFLPPLLPTNQQPLLQYVIFPLQFAYLYSYYPSGSMKGLPTELKERWEKEHKIQAEAAFQKVEEEGQSVGAPSFFQKADMPLTVMTATKEETTE